MGVVMKGGTSGNRTDALPPANPSYDKQVPQNTANNSAGSNLNLCQNTANGATPGAPGLMNPPVPGGGTPDDAAV